MKCLIHITKECDDLLQCQTFYEEVKADLFDKKNVHVNGQVTVKFSPSHPEGIDEQGNPI